jgi:hypothetical protein
MTGMSKATAIREAGHPLSKPDREAILLELQDVLASPHFCNSKRYPALLEYIVEKTLAGEADLLKERTLGVEVFDRPASYDTNADTVVRYTAGEVRKRLSLYYHELGRRPRIRISLPPGSYVPEFIHEPGQLDPSVESHGQPATYTPNSHVFAAIDGVTQQHGETSLPAFAEGAPLAASREDESRARTPGQRSARTRRRWIALVAAVALIALAAAGWRYRAVQPRTPLDAFWTPVLHDQSAVTVCIGGSVFAQNSFSGVATATKDVDYPFVSMQTASAVAQLSALLERSGGATTQLQSAATTPLTELREHPIILLGAYNNQWTLRLVQPLRFHFSPDPNAEAIVDEAHPGARWARDPSLPYSSADDYALVARFRDTTTDSWIVVLAGVGRNGTEAAAQFATSPHYMQLLRDQAGANFSNRNVEAVLKVSVIDGKTGAPSLMAVHVW